MVRLWCWEESEEEDVYEWEEDKVYENRKFEEID